VQVL
jgi:hypothetical protein